MPLKGIPFILSPDLLHVLCSAGHGDEIVLADIHFPTSSICRHGPREIRMDGHGIPTLLEAILAVFPLDAYVDFPVAVMDLVLSDKDRGQPVVWQEYEKIINTAEKTRIQFEKVERFEFYERAKRAFAIVHTGDWIRVFREWAQYGNIIIKKGIVLPTTSSS